MTVQPIAEVQNTTTWKKHGVDFEYEIDDGHYTGEYRRIGGQLADGRWQQWNFLDKDKETRYVRETFPDGRTQMLACELPPGWMGYVDDHGANIGIEGFEFRPGFVSRSRVVYASPRPGAEAQLECIHGVECKFTLPPGELFGGRSTFPVVFPDL